VFQSIVAFPSVIKILATSLGETGGDSVPQV
jgi:uncharacterized membrane-anchored protein